MGRRRKLQVRYDRKNRLTAVVFDTQPGAAHDGGSQKGDDNFNGQKTTIPPDGLCSAVFKCDNRAGG